MRRPVLVSFSEVGGDFLHHLFGVEVDFDAADGCRRRCCGRGGWFSALEFDAATDQAVDDVHEGDLYGFLVFKQGRVMKARARGVDGAEHALVEVAELLSAESGDAFGKEVRS